MMRGAEVAEPTPLRTGEGEPSIGELVATASRDMSVLIRKEIELAKAEIAADMKRAGLGGGLLAGAGFFGAFALTFMSVAGAFAIHYGGVGLGVSFLCMGLVFGGAMMMLALLGIKKLIGIKPPRRTIQSVKDDIAWARHPTMPPSAVGNDRTLS